MSTYISAYQLINFQSWDDTASQIDLEPHMVNIIEGANETGKSVLYKVLYNFCFPGYSSASELIRYGCKMGILLLQLDDGAIIMYCLSRSDYSYFLIEKDNTKKEWTNQGCPDEIIERMGLILDKETQIILNVIDSDGTLPFIKTTPKFNASLIQAIVEPESMTNFFANLADTLKRTETATAHFSNKANTLQTEINNIPYIDSLSLEIRKEQVDACLDLAMRYNALEEKLYKLLSLLEQSPNEVSNPIKIQYKLAVYDKIMNCIQQLHTLTDIKKTDILEIQSPESNEHSIIIYDRLTKLVAQIQVLASFKTEKPEIVSFKDCTTEFSILSYLTDLRSKLFNYISQKNTLTDFSIKVDMLRDELQEIIDKVGICPTCGQLLRCNYE